LVCYFTCQKKDDPLYYCCGTETLWSINPDHRRLYQVMEKRSNQKKPTGTKYLKLNKSQSDLFFDVFKMEPPTVRVHGEKRHNQETIHVCHPLTLQEIGDLVLADRIRTTAYDTPQLKMDTFWVSQVENTIRQQYPGWSPTLSHSASVAKGFIC